MTSRPQAVVIAGPNGAGKTSAAPELLRDAVGIGAFVNADVIAQGLSGFSPQSAAFEAGRVMLRRLRELARERTDFAFESTLSGRSAYRLLKTMRADGYDVHIFYLWLPTAEFAVARVHRRVEAGGHDVPDAVVRRRFWKSLLNFDSRYRPLATSWRLYDGSGVEGRPLIAHGTLEDTPAVLDAGRWANVRTMIEEAP